MIYNESNINIHMRRLDREKNYLVSIYLLEIPYYFSFLVISFLMNVIDLLLLLILLSSRFSYLNTIIPPWYVS